MKTKPKIAVIGAGVIGAAAAFELARSGRFRAVVIERKPTAGAGSTAASTAVIRQFYRAGESVLLARAGLRVWSDWAQWLGPCAPKTPLARFVRTGALWIFPETAREKETPHIRRCQELGVPLETLSQAQLRARFPAFRFPDDPPVFGLYEPDAGYVDQPALAAQNLMKTALNTGNAELMTDARLVDLSPEGPVVRHGGVRKTVPADAVLNAAGPHSYQVGAVLGAPLPLATAPNRQQFIDAQETQALQRHPDAPICADLQLGFYMKPDPGRFRVGSILPEDDREFVRNPDRFNRSVSPGFAREKTGALQKRMPEARLQNRSGGAALYDVTVADWKPIIDKTDAPNCFAAVGTSGAWFKGAPVIGLLIREIIRANLIENRDTDKRPLSITLPYTEQTLDLSAFSRNRPPNAPQRGVVG